MPKIDPEELKRKLQQDIADSKALIEKLKEQDLLDEDGYPTVPALDIIETWHWYDARGWFDFIKSIWWYPGWGWREIDEKHEYKPDTIAHRYYVSTGGWSGNESVISAMQRNHMMWHMNWVQSRRGGHYIFELKEFEDEKQSD